MRCLRETSEEEVRRSGQNLGSTEIKMGVGRRTALLHPESGVLVRVPESCPGLWTVQVAWSGECCEPLCCVHGGGVEKRSPGKGHCLVQERGTLADIFAHSFIMNLSNIFTVEERLMSSHAVSPPAPRNQHTPVLFNLLFLPSLPSPLVTGTQISGIVPFQPRTFQQLSLKDKDDFF